MDNLRFDNDNPIKFEHILAKDKCWYCYNCNKRINNENINCDECKIFKPLEIFKNVLYNPMKVTDDEI